jgi:hypothetical protein
LFSLHYLVLILLSSYSSPHSTSSPYPSLSSILPFLPFIFLFIFLFTVLTSTLCFHDLKEIAYVAKLGTFAL